MCIHGQREKLSRQNLDVKFINDNMGGNARTVCRPLIKSLGIDLFVSQAEREGEREKEYTTTAKYYTQIGPVEL